MSCPRSAALLAQRRIAPSILAADYSRLGAQVAEVMAAGARILHVDVMDGHFVPPITIGALIVEALHESVHDAGGLLDVHLMVERPERHVAAFASAGADIITVHAEATPHLHHVVGAVRQSGCRAGVAINPATPPIAIAGVLGIVDLVLCMTVNPGWGGQAFIPSSLEKIGLLRELIPPGLPLQIDGGVGEANASECTAVGATLLVAGSAIFTARDPGEAYRRLAAAAGAA